MPAHETISLEAVATLKRGTSTVSSVQTMEGWGWIFWINGEMAFASVGFFASEKDAIADAKGKLALVYLMHQPPTVSVN